MNHRHQLSTTAAADGLQQGSGLRRIVCLAALLVIFVASGVRAAGTYTVTVYNGATISSNDYKALSALCSPLGLMNGNTSGGKAEFLYQSKDHYFTCNTSTYKCSFPATTLPIEKSFPITAYKTILQQSGTYTWLANYDAIKLVLAVAVDGQNFPDDNFREYVGSKTIDKDEDGYLSDEEIEAVTEIDVMHMDIEDLTGIGYFTALKTLYAGGNKLTELDLSKNTALDYLDCSDNQLTELDLGENTALTTLYCGGNQLTELDLRNNTKLESVNICNSQIYGEAMDRLIESLPTRTVGLGFGRFYAVDTNSETEGNIITKLQKHNLSAKRWSTLNARGNGYYPETIPGDFNGDGLVNTQDIDCLRDYILGIKSDMYIFTEAELTDDLKADIVDLTQLIQLLTE